MARQAGAGLQLDTIEVEKSPICRLDSDCWDVKLVFFDTTNYLAPRTVFRITADVSDVVPVSVGDPRYAYNESEGSLAGAFFERSRP
jgi:hypothetical protein